MPGPVEGGGGSSQWTEDGSGNLVPMGGEPVSIDELQNAGDILVFRNDGSLIERIAPSTTTTPVQDAVDDADAVGGGRVLLPPGTTDTPGLIDPKTASVVGPDMRACELNVTNDNPAFDFATSNSDYLEAGRFSIISDAGVTSTTHAIRYSAGVENVDWLPIFIDGFAGVERVTAGNPFQITHRNIRTVNMDGSDLRAAFDLTGQGPMWSYDLLSVYPDDSRTGANTDLFYTNNAELKIGQFNIGGTPNRALINEGAAAVIDQVNYEAVGQPAAAPSIIQQGGSITGSAQGDRTTRVRTLRASGNFDTMWHGKALPRGCRCEWLAAFSTPNTNRVVYDDDIAVAEQAGRFDGIPSSDVTLNDANLTKTADKGTIYVTT